MIYVISKATFGSYNVRDIQCNANWDCCPYSDYALIPDRLVDGILATQGYCDITLNSAGTEVTGFTARSIPAVPEECCGANTVLSVNGVKANTEGELTLKHSNVGAAPAQLHITKQLTTQGWYKIGTMTAGDGSFHCGAATLYIPGHYAASVPPVSIVDIVIAYNSAKAKTRIAAGTLTNQITKVGLIAESNSKYGVYIYYSSNKANNAAVYVDKIGGYFTTEQFTASDVAESNMISVAYVNEYDDPPMKLGVEYRTTERYNEKPVYTKLISFGALPKAAQGTAPHGISSIDKAIRWCARAGGSSMVLTNWSAVTDFGVDATKIYITTGSDVSWVTADIQIWYLKP